MLIGLGVVLLIVSPIVSITPAWVVLNVLLSFGGFYILFDMARIIIGNKWLGIEVDDRRIIVHTLFVCQEYKWDKIQDVVFCETPLRGHVIELIGKNGNTVYWLLAKTLKTLDPERLYLTLRGILNSKNANAIDENDAKEIYLKMREERGLDENADKAKENSG